MRVAVLTLTRDRLEFTKHCFATLQENAGCEFDHYILDQGSTDGTPDWLADVYAPDFLTVFDENVGISKGMNFLLDQVGNHYDVIVKFDNDCELRTPNTLRDICQLTNTFGLLLSPVIHGLRNPPPTIGKPLSLGGSLVDEKHQIGGIFLSAPADLYEGFRYSVSNPKWGGDDVQVCAHWRDQDGLCGYVQGYDAWHYLGTDGQHERDTVYRDRKFQEMGL